jgi:hypothetical protein
MELKDAAARKWRVRREVRLTFAVIARLQARKCVLLLSPFNRHAVSAFFTPAGMNIAPYWLVHQRQMSFGTEKP